MRAKAIAAIAAATLIAALLLPGGATAGESTVAARQHHPTVIASTAFFGTNGYLVSMSLVDRSKLKIAVFPEGGEISGSGLGFVTTEYTLAAPQRRGSNQIKASLGRLGRIDVRFVPETVEEEEPLFSLCKGEMDTIEAGHFVGLIAFRGERGYTRARRQRAPGSVTIAPAPSCHKETGHKPQVRSPHQRAREALLATARKAAKSDAHLLAVGATKTAGNRKVVFAGLRLSTVHKGKEVAFDTFIATATRDRGRIHEASTATELFAHGPFFKVPDLTHPTLESVLAPPKPFLGGATLIRDSADKVSWKGDLRVNLPGFGVVPLVGPGFKAIACADSGCHLE